MSQPNTPPAITLTGLDGKNPLGFLAALGVLEVASASPGLTPTLSWSTRGRYLPTLHGVDGAPALRRLLEADRDRFRDSPVIERLRYAKSGEPGAKQARDLKPPPREFAAYLDGLVTDYLAGRGLERRHLDLVAAFATDVVIDGNGNTKPTALHFTAGQQEFMAMVRELVAEVSSDDFDEALFGPWRYQRPLPVLQWDNATARDYALRASDPAKDKKLGVPGADWLAFRGLAFLPVAPVNGRVVTTGCSGGWKTGTFRWPLWEPALPRAVVRALLTSADVVEDPDRLAARGVGVVFEAGIRRSEQGGYGSFTPARTARGRAD